MISKYFIFWYYSKWTFFFCKVVSFILILCATVVICSASIYGMNPQHNAIIFALFKLSVMFHRNWESKKVPIFVFAQIFTISSVICSFVLTWLLLWYIIFLSIKNFFMLFYSTGLLSTNSQLFFIWQCLYFTLIFFEHIVTGWRILHRCFVVLFSILKMMFSCPLSSNVWQKIRCHFYPYFPVFNVFFSYSFF